MGSFIRGEWFVEGGRKQSETEASTFVGSRLTRPQARAATPLQLRETATMPIESGPGYKITRNKLTNILKPKHYYIGAFACTF